MSIPSCVITKKGLALLAKTPTGAEVPVTRWQIGTGALSAEAEAADLEALVTPLKYIPVSSCTNQGKQALVLGQFTNTGMDAFTWEELGLWATDPDEGEILYAVGNARGEGELIEGYTTKIREFIFGMELAFDSAANVSVTVNETLIFATKTELKEALESKADLDPETGKVKSEQLPDLGAWRRVFEQEEFSSGELRIPKTEHGITPTTAECMYQLRGRTGRTALDYYGDSAALGRTAITNAMIAALAANEAAAGTYPTASDGHVQLTWNQVQDYILTGSLKSDTEAQTALEAVGADWQDTVTVGTVATATLEEVLAAAYVPALGGSSGGLDSLCTAAVLQGLRLRRKADNAGTVTAYDLNGYFVPGFWAAMEDRVYWDLDTSDLVISGDAFAGDVQVVQG